MPIIATLDAIITVVVVVVTYFTACHACVAGGRVNHRWQAGYAYFTTYENRRAEVVSWWRVDGELMEGSAKGIELMAFSYCAAF